MKINEETNLPEFSWFDWLRAYWVIPLHFIAVIIWIYVFMTLAGRGHF